MTATVKLDPALEARLRLRASTTGRSTSEVIRAALLAFLDAPEAAPPLSAFALGADLFGRHAGSAELASERKQALADIWGQRHDQREAG